VSTDAQLMRIVCMYGLTKESLKRIGKLFTLTFKGSWKIIEWLFIDETKRNQVQKSLSAGIHFLSVL